MSIKTIFAFGVAAVLASSMLSACGGDDSSPETTLPETSATSNPEQTSTTTSENGGTILASNGEKILTSYYTTCTEDGCIEDGGLKILESYPENPGVCVFQSSTREYDAWVDASADDVASNNFVVVLAPTHTQLVEPLFVEQLVYTSFDSFYTYGEHDDLFIQGRMEIQSGHTRIQEAIESTPSNASFVAVENVGQYALMRIESVSVEGVLEAANEYFAAAGLDEIEFVDLYYEALQQVGCK